MAAKRRLQSAMEYLMTYGWAILIIAVALGALYQLGVFGNSSTTSQTSCLAIPGFLCQNPLLNTTGWLGVTFGQIGAGTITITNTACTLNTTAPSSTQTISVTLAPEQTSAIPFSCQLSANAIGTVFRGYLWLVYNTQATTGVVSRIATVTTKVTTTGNVTSALGGIAIPKFTATCGGTLTLVSGNDICAFTSSGTFTVTGGSGNVAALVVAGGGGGGGGGGQNGGGGGGGGYQFIGSFAVVPQAYPVTVGGGGSGGVSSTSSTAGGNSVFSTITALGGGGGASGGTCAGSGGSGGGGNNGCSSGGAGTAGQGNNGGSGAAGEADGGGGSGAGGAAGSSGSAGSGGVGTSSSISGSSTYYSGGGGGAANGGVGSGGGGTGGTNGAAGTANTGGGGGGGGGFGGDTGGTGGSGIVIISFNAAGNGNP